MASCFLRIAQPGLAALVALAAIDGAPVAAGESALPTLGQSLGGHVRGAPSIDAYLQDTLPKGRQIVIVEDTGKSYQGYNWFRIRAGTEHDDGYQWGGIMCSNGEKIANLAAVCDPDAMLQLDTAHKGLEGLQGDYWRYEGQSDGSLSSACGADGQVVLGEVNVSERQIEFRSRVCTVSDAKPNQTGLHVRGTCTANTFMGADPLTRFDEPLDVLVLQSQDKSLSIVTLSGVNKGVVDRYQFCPSSQP